MIRSKPISARMASAAAALLALAGAAASAEPARYVAMGSSFAAGPGITRPADQTPDGCGRSADNYAHQLARRRGLNLVDVSCSGAVTASLLQPWKGHPAQIDALTTDTRLVTVTIGGNDVGYIAGLGAGACRFLAPKAADAGAPGKCPAASTAREDAYTELAAQMKRIAEAVRARAPSARLVFVDYPAVLPASGSCAMTPLSAADADASRTVARRVVEITRQAALESGATYVAASALSTGHDVCGSAPWMNGFPVPAGVAAFHLNLAGMTAIADALDHALPR